MKKDEWNHMNGNAWARLATAGPSIFIDLYSDGIQILSLDDAKLLRSWLDDAIDRMEQWEEQ